MVLPACARKAGARHKYRIDVFGERKRAAEPKYRVLGPPTIATSKDRPPKSVCNNERLYVHRRAARSCGYKYGVTPHQDKSGG